MLITLGVVKHTMPFKYFATSYLLASSWLQSFWSALYLFQTVYLMIPNNSLFLQIWSALHYRIQIFGASIWISSKQEKVTFQISSINFFTFMEFILFNLYRPWSTFMLPFYALFFVIVIPLFFTSHRKLRIDRLTE